MKSAGVGYLPTSWVREERAGSVFAAHVAPQKYAFAVETTDGVVFEFESVDGQGSDVTLLVLSVSGVGAAKLSSLEGAKLSVPSDSRISARVPIVCRADRVDGVSMSLRIPGVARVAYV